MAMPSCVHKRCIALHQFSRRHREAVGEQEKRRRQIKVSEREKKRDESNKKSAIRRFGCMHILRSLDHPSLLECWVTDPADDWDRSAKEKTKTLLLQRRETVLHAQISFVWRTLAAHVVCEILRPDECCSSKWIGNAVSLGKQMQLIRHHVLLSRIYMKWSATAFVMSIPFN
jgi:hypothetical protein